MPGENVHIPATSYVRGVRFTKHQKSNSKTRVSVSTGAISTTPIRNRWAINSKPWELPPPGRFLFNRIDLSTLTKLVGYRFFCPSRCTESDSRIEKARATFKCTTMTKVQRSPSLRLTDRYLAKRTSIDRRKKKKETRFRASVEPRFRFQYL